MHTPRGALLMARFISPAPKALTNTNSIRPFFDSRASPIFIATKIIMSLDFCRNTIGDDFHHATFLVKSVCNTIFLINNAKLLFAPEGAFSTDEKNAQRQNCGSVLRSQIQDAADLISLEVSSSH